MNLKINGQAFDGVSCKIEWLGNQARLVSAASYGFTRDHQNNYYLGSDEPGDYSMSPKKYEEGSITMSMTEVVSIEKAAISVGNDITLLKAFPTIFTYLNGGNEIVADEVTWKFSKWGREVNSDDMGAAMEFSMHIIKIKPSINTV